MTVKLTDAQLVLLSAASQRKDLCVIAPERMKGVVLAKVTKKLVNLGLVREVQAKATMPVWRRDEAGQGYALKLTGAGLKAIAVDEGVEGERATSKATRPQLGPDPTKASSPGVASEPAQAPAPRAGSKLARVINLLERADGATVVQLTEATGWLQHTARAAVTGLRKRGYGVVLERMHGADSIYRIAGPAADRVDRVVVQAEVSKDGDRGPEPKVNVAA